MFISSLLAAGFARIRHYLFGGERGRGEREDAIGCHFAAILLLTSCRVLLIGIGGRVLVTKKGGVWCKKRGKGGSCKSVCVQADGCGRSYSVPNSFFP